MKKWWSKMMDMRSYQTVVLLLAKYLGKSRDFGAVIETAREYPHTNVYKTSLMSHDLGIFDLNDKKIEYNFDRLMELLEYIENEQD
jgi:hypothetical protein